MLFINKLDLIYACFKTAHFLLNRLREHQNIDQH